MDRTGKIERAVLCTAAAIAALVAIADLFGLLSTLPWFQRHIATLTLVLLSSVTAFVVLTLSKRVDECNQNTQRILSHQRKDTLASLSSLADQVDPVITGVLGDYIGSLLVTLRRAVGDRVVDFHDVDLFRYFWKRTLTQLPARSEIVHTSLPCRNYFWADGSYEDCLRAFVARGCRMRRVFFLNGLTSVDDEEVQHVLCKQLDCGVEVYVTDVADVPSHLHVLLSADQKKRIGCHVTVGTTNEIVQTSATSDPEVVQKYLNVFNGLLHLKGTRQFTSDGLAAVTEKAV